MRVASSSPSNPENLSNLGIRNRAHSWKLRSHPSGPVEILKIMYTEVDGDLCVAHNEETRNKIDIHRAIISWSIILYRPPKVELVPKPMGFCKVLSIVVQ